MKGIFQRLALASASTVAMLFVLEFVVRLIAPQQLIVLRPDIWRPARLVGHHHMTNANTTVNLGEGEVRFVSDVDGHRIDPDSPPPSDPGVSVLFIGDSFVEGLQVESGAVMGEVLRGLLQNELGRSALVVNAGVGGWNPNHYLLEARRALGKRRFDLGIVALYVGNDTVETVVDSFPQRPYATRHRFRVPREMKRREVIDSLLYPINDFLETHSQLFILARSTFHVQLAKIGLTPLRFPPIYERSEAASARWTTTANICGKIRDAFEVESTPVLFVLLPTNYQVHEEVFDDYVESFGIDPESVDLRQPNSLLASAFDARGLHLIDPLDEMVRKGASGLRMYGSVDNHFNDFGHRSVAEVILPHVVGLVAGADEASGEPAPSPKNGRR